MPIVKIGKVHTMWLDGPWSDCLLIPGICRRSVEAGDIMTTSSRDGRHTHTNLMNVGSSIRQIGDYKGMVSNKSGNVCVAVT